MSAKTPAIKPEWSLANRMKNRLSNLFWALFGLLALIPGVSNAQVIISGGPDATTLTGSVKTAFEAAAAVGVATLGVGFVVYMVRKGMKLRP